MMAERFNLRTKKWQRGNFSMFPAGTISASSAGGEVVVNVRFYTNNEVAGTHQCRVRFKSDGETTQVDDTTEQGGAGGEWWSLEPVTGIGSSYEVRALSSGKVGTWSGTAAADNTWITINIDRTWHVESTAPTTKTTSATFEVGPDGVESADDSATIQCSVSYV